MIIDFHTHVFPDKLAERAVDKLAHEGRIRPFSDGTADGLAESMERAGIDLSVVLPVATSPNQVESINESAAQLSASDLPLISFGGIHPEYSGFRTELNRISSLGLRGIKIHPVYQHTDLDDIRFLRILDRAAELGLIVVTHTGDDIGFPGMINCSPKMARHAIDEIGDFKFVCAHMGGWGVWDDAVRCLAGTSAFIDTSFSTGRITPIGGADEAGSAPPFPLDMLDEKQFLDMCSAFGADHILFGTDSPWSSPEESVRFIDDLPLDREDKDRIFSKNAKALLNLDQSI